MASIDMARGHTVRLGLERLSRVIGIDPRLLGMLLVLVVIWLVLNIATGGTFLSARNLFNLSLQVAVVGVMATAWCWSSCRATSTYHRSQCSASSACSALMRRSGSVSARLHLVGDEPGDAARHRDRRGRGAITPMAACHPSSSRWAASCSSAMPPSDHSAPPSPRSTRRSAAGGGLGSTIRGVLELERGGVAIFAIVASR
jgi:hypothetical protein